MEIEEYLRMFLVQNNWDDEYTQNQARALFTTYCLINNIDADTSKCDDVLTSLYAEAAINELETYESFENFMIGCIV